MEKSFTLGKQKLGIGLQALAALIAVAAAVALPQALHLFGQATGLGTLPGETYLPMHLPVILVGFLAGPIAGGLAGAASPLISSALTGMPLPAMVPFMVIELFMYGLTSGFLARKEDGMLGVAIKVLLVQIAGRAVRALAILISFYALGNTAVAPDVILGSIPAGLPGIAIQLVLIPAVLAAVSKLSSGERA